MPRPKKTDRPVEKNISLPTSIVARCELEMYSALEGKLPFGAWQKFLTGLINEHFARVDRRKKFSADWKELDECCQGVSITPAFVELAKNALEKEGYYYD